MNVANPTRTHALPAIGNPIGYPFDPIPKRALELVEQGTITRTDYLVLVELLKFRRLYRGSCWTTKKTIAQALGITTKTVQRSYRRLSDAGLIRMAQVAVPDSDEPRNRTGFRIHFLFIDAIRPAGPEDRRPPAARTKPAGTPAKQACILGGGEDMGVLPPRDTNVLSPQDTHVLPPEDTDVPQCSKDLRPSDRRNLDDDNKTEHPCMSSSSSNPSHHKDEPDKVDELFRRAAEVAQTIPDLTRLCVADWVRQYGLALATWAVVLLARLLSHPDPQRRPGTAHYAEKPLRKWRSWCGEIKPEDLPADTRDSVLGGVQADVQTQTRLCGSPAGNRSPALFNAATVLARMKTVGWRLVGVGNGQVQWEEIPDSGACAWESIPSDLRELIKAHKAELKAHVLVQAGKGVSRAVPTAVRPTGEGCGSRPVRPAAIRCPRWRRVSRPVGRARRRGNGCAAV